jgi:hypothetical protein
MPDKDYVTKQNEQLCEIKVFFEAAEMHYIAQCHHNFTITT